MIAIANIEDITDIELDSDWTILEYDTNNTDGSNLVSIQYTNVEPSFAFHLFNQQEYENFKLSPVWGAVEE